MGDSASDDERPPGPDVRGSSATDGDSTDAAAREKFLRDARERGEAVPAGEELPPGATHEIDEGDDGEPALHRRRFSAF